MLRARKAGVHTPSLYHVELPSSSIYMEKILGSSVKALLLGGTLSSEGVVSSRVSEERVPGSNLHAWLCTEVPDQVGWSHLHRVSHCIS